MPNSIDPFALYLEQLARLGHDRNWLRRNAPALHERFARDPRGFAPPPAPPGAVRARYDELD